MSLVASSATEGRTSTGAIKVRKTSWRDKATDWIEMIKAGELATQESLELGYALMAAVDQAPMFEASLDEDDRKMLSELYEKLYDGHLRQLSLLKNRGELACTREWKELGQAICSDLQEVLEATNCCAV